TNAALGSGGAQGASYGPVAPDETNPFWAGEIELWRFPSAEAVCRSGQILSLDSRRVLCYPH
ncbi:MAG: hypothetical protein ACRD9L_16410, partial [Bryobacteraceae bacterium]